MEVLMVCPAAGQTIDVPGINMMGKNYFNFSLSII
jgi:hypothetical protein